MTEPKPAEPSMEEILASIRQIINQNDAPADETQEAPQLENRPFGMAADAAEVDDAPEDDDVLELTNILEDEPIAVNAVEDVPAYQPEPTVRTIQQPSAGATTNAAAAQELITGMTAAAATAALNNLAATLQSDRAEHSLPFGNPGRTLESMVVEAIKPLLKDWLDDNLPSLVERVVQAEVEKLTRRVGG